MIKSIVYWIVLTFILILSSCSSRQNLISEYSNDLEKAKEERTKLEEQTDLKKWRGEIRFSVSSYGNLKGEHKIDSLNFNFSGNIFYQITETALLGWGTGIYNLKDYSKSEAYYTKINLEIVSFRKYLTENLGFFLEAGLGYDLMFSIKVLNDNFYFQPILRGGMGYAFWGEDKKSAWIFGVDILLFVNDINTKESEPKTVYSIYPYLGFIF